MELRTIRSRDILSSFFGFWVAWAVMQAIVIHFSTDFSFSLSAFDAILTGSALALACYGMLNVLRFYQPRQVFRIAYSAGLAVISMLAMRYTALLIPAEEGYEEFLNQFLLLRILIAWIMISLFSATAWLWFTLRDQQEMENRRNENEKFAREAELARLRQQLQPHFLFNSLNSISALVVTRPEEARRMIQQLSDFLRGTLKKDDQQLVLLTEEIEHLQLYLEIEKVRFGHRLQTRIFTEPDAGALRIPSLLLQPVVENAIKFGLYDTTGEITISIEAQRRDSSLIVTVQNPFDTQTTAPRHGTGFGLSSVQRRLYLLFARHDLLSTRQAGNIFTTTIVIPQNS